MGQVIRSTAGPDVARGFTQPTATKLERAMPFFVALIPLAMALMLVPGRSVSADACPPGGEGLAACQLQKGWAPYVTSVCLVWLGLYVAGQFAFLGIPRIVAHLRAGDRLVREPKLPGVLTHDNPAIAAAVWGQSATATPETRVMSGFAWSQAASRSGRVTATPAALLGAVAPRTQAAAPAAAPLVVPPPAPQVALDGGLSLNVCGECLAIVESEPTDAEISCPSCGTTTRRQPRVRPAAARPAAPARAATRVVLLSGALDGRGFARLQQAVTRRPGEPRRIVVLQLPAGETVDTTAREALRQARAAARAVEGEIVVVARDKELRDALLDVGLPLATSTTDAMELAADLDAGTPAQASRFAIDRVAI